VGKPIVVESRDLAPKIDKKLKYKFSDLDLYQDLQQLNLRHFKKFGAFYTEDFTIYHVGNLDLLEDNMYIVEIYLYYIDRRLHKIQALTTKNMADVFLSKYGGAKLVVNDRFNKDLVKKEGAIYKRAGRTHMNKNLNNYKLKWKQNDRSIAYMVDESAQKNFETIEEMVELEGQTKMRYKPKYVFTIQSDEYPQLLSRVKYEEILARK
jgi:hypothetical protein